MEKRLRNTLIVSGILGGFAVFGYTMYRTIMKAMKIDVKPSNISILNKDSNGISLSIDLLLKNPSDLKLILQAQEYDIYLNGVFITRLNTDVPQTLLPNAISTLNLQLNLNYKDLLAKLNVATGVGIADKINVITNLKSQRLKLDAKLNVKYGILPSIPIDYIDEGTLRSWGM